MDSNTEEPNAVSTGRIAVRDGHFEESIIQWVRDSVVGFKGSGWTLLHETAINDKFLDKARYLIYTGAIVDCKTVNGMTPFYIACKFGSVSVAKMLIEAGCNINAPVPFEYIDNKCFINFTPFHVACFLGNTEIVKLLIENNVDINSKTGQSHTPVHIALCSSTPSTLRVLIEAGANLRMKDSQGYTPLHHACRIGNLKMFNVLIKYLGCGESVINQQTPQGTTLLMLACDFQHLAIVKRLIELGADTTIVNCFGLLALHLAAYCKFELFKLVLLNTPPVAIEKYAVFRSHFQSFRSLPCILIDCKKLESLKLLYQTNVSEEVLKCPTKMQGCLISPICHLLKFSSTWRAVKKRLLILEFLFSFEFLIDPVYVSEGIPQLSVSIFEIIIQDHSTYHFCRCQRFLSFNLSKISSPHKGLPNNASRQLSMFMKAAREGFVSGLDLLQYTTIIEPDHVLEMFISALFEKKSNSSFRGIDRGKINVAVLHLIKKCTFNFMPKMMSIKKFTELLHPQRAIPDILMIVYDAIKSNTSVMSLKRICRFNLRKQIRLESNNTSFESFRNHLQNLELPLTLSRYILYEEDF